MLVLPSSLVPNPKSRRPFWSAIILPYEAIALYVHKYNRSFSAQGDRIYRELLMNNDCIATKFYQTTFLE